MEKSCELRHLLLSRHALAKLHLAEDRRIHIGSRGDRPQGQIAVVAQGTQPFAKRRRLVAFGINRSRHLLSKSSEIATGAQVKSIGAFSPTIHRLFTGYPQGSRDPVSVGSLKKLLFMNAEPRMLKLYAIQAGG